MDKEINKRGWVFSGVGISVGAFLMTFLPIFLTKCEDGKWLFFDIIIVVSLLILLLVKKKQSLRQQFIERLQGDFDRRHKFFLPQASSSPLELEMKRSQKEAGGKESVTDQDLIRVFTDAEHELAILGQPGSGKTSCLLQLFDHLLNKAENDENAKLPVVFECSEWSGEELIPWMADWMQVTYNISDNTAEKLLQDKKIFPLFDGLEELAQAQQEAFMQALSGLQKKQPLVVCCRLEEYQQLKDLVKFNNTVTLQDLPPEKVKAYLQDNKLDALWDVLQAEDAMQGSEKKQRSLLQLIQRPLFLGIALELQEELIATEKKNEEDPEQLLWRLYLDKSLAATGCCAGEKCTLKHSPHWLRCLADRISRNQKVVLRTEELQPNWLYRPWKFGIAYGLTVGLTVGLAFGLAFGLWPACWADCGPGYRLGWRTEERAGRWKE